VLIVDADAPIRGLLATVVKRLPRRPVLAADGRRAIELLSTCAFDAVILELLVSGTSGDEILDHIAATQPQLLSRVIVVTTSTKIDRTSGALASVAAVIRKPFAVDELQSALQSCCAV
jgi:CheY-like chemotaxis protein